LNLSKFFMMSSLLILSLFFNSCGEAEKLKQLEAQLESQNRNLLNVQSDLRSEKQKRIQIEEAFKQKVEEDNENLEISEIIEDIKPSQNDKVFIREYTYRASEDDSKNSSRKKAVQQLKVILSEEVGTHIESYLDIKKQNINGVAYKSINSEIKSLSSSITKLEVLKEKWDGRNYWIKAKVRINEKRTMELLLTAIKSKSNEKDIKRLNKILTQQKRQLSYKSKEVQDLNKKLVTEEIVNEARKNEIIEMKQQLVKYQQEEIKQKKKENELDNLLQNQTQELKKQNSKVIEIREALIKQKEKLLKYQAEEIKNRKESVKFSQEISNIKSKLKPVKSRIDTETEKACLMKRYMSKQEVEKILGKPSSIDDRNLYGIYCNQIKFYPFKANCTNWFYGKTRLSFGTNGLLERKYGCE